MASDHRGQPFLITAVPSRTPLIYYPTLQCVGGWDNPATLSVESTTPTTAFVVTLVVVETSTSGDRIRTAVASSNLTTLNRNPTAAVLVVSPTVGAQTIHHDVRHPLPIVLTIPIEGSRRSRIAIISDGVCLGPTLPRITPLIDCCRVFHEFP